MANTYCDSTSTASFVGSIIVFVRKILNVFSKSFEMLAVPVTTKVAVLKTKAKRATESLVAKVHRIFMLPTILSVEH